MNTLQTRTRSQCRWEADVGHQSVYEHIKSVLPYSRLKGLAGSTSVMSVAMW